MALLVMFECCAALGEIPEGYKLARNTVSPDGRYGVFVLSEDNPGDEILIDLKTKATITAINPREGEVYKEIDTIAVWSKDSSTLVLSLLGKWGPVRMIVVELRNGTIVYRTEILESLEKEILDRFKKEQPNLYKKVSEALVGNHPGSDGFTIDVHAIQSENPRRVYITAGLTSDPNMTTPQELHVEARLDGESSSRGEIIFGNFDCYTPDEIVKQNEVHEEALRTEYVESQQLLQHLFGKEKESFEKDESDWKTAVNDRASTEGFSFSGIGWDELETSLYRDRANDLLNRLKKTKNP